MASRGINHTAAWVHKAVHQPVLLRRAWIGAVPAAHACRAGVIPGVRLAVVRPLTPSGGAGARLSS